MIWNIRKQKQPIRTRRRKKGNKSKDSVSSLLNNFKCSNIHIIGMPEGEEKEQEIGNLFEKIMKENFPSGMKEIDMQIQEAQRIPNKMNAKRPTLRPVSYTHLTLPTNNPWCRSRWSPYH